MPLDLNMNGDELVRYLKEFLLKGKQTPICISDPPKRLTIGG
jgi:hypothetical protein